MIPDYTVARERLAKSPFRSRFFLTDKERAYIAEKGWSVVEGQARRILTERLAPAQPMHDGSQTPMRGHVVFKAQHATATCCRGCLFKWYGIPQGYSLTEEELNAAVGLIVGWLRDRAGDLSKFPVSPDLF